MSDDAGAPGRVGGSVGLLALGLALLAGGHFIQLDDTSGFGSDEWILPLGVVGVLAGIAGLVVAWPDRIARRTLGLALLLLLFLLVWQDVTNEGFRFIWSSYEGEFAFLEIGLALVALALVATSVRARPGRRHQPGGRWWVRAVGYLAVTVVAMLVAFFGGVGHYEATQCTDTSGDCDLGGLEGLVWATGALVVAPLAATTIEVVLWRRRRRSADHQT